MMDNWLRHYALDIRFVDLAIFVSLLVWPWLILATAGMALVAWKFVLICQAIALPFSIIGWAAGFRAGRRIGFQRRRAAMVAGWAGLVAAECGLAFVLWLYWGQVQWGPGLWALPALALLVTVGVLWFYRDATWSRWELWNEGMTN